MKFWMLGQTAAGLCWFKINKVKVASFPDIIDQIIGKHVIKNALMVFAQMSCINKI